MAKRTDDTGPRAELDAAIIDRNAASAQIERLNAAKERISDNLFQARRSLEGARGANEAEQHERVRRLVEGDTAVLSKTNSNAVSEAEEAITACKSALALINAEISEAETLLGYKDLRVKSAAGSVMAPALEEILAGAAILLAELQGKRAILKAMAPMLPAELGRKIDRAFTEPVAPAGPHTAVASWRAACEALMRDAAAPLPHRG